MACTGISIRYFSVAVGVDLVLDRYFSVGVGVDLVLEVYSVEKPVSVGTLGLRELPAARGSGFRV